MRSRKIGGGLCLGMFLFAIDYAKSHGRFPPGAQQRLDDHEWGHFVQSCMLGPLYIPIVGIPSIIGQIRFNRSKSRTVLEYYSRYPEAWADRLGRVTRE
jgi:hypothetical protein